MMKMKNLHILTTGMKIIYMNGKCHKLLVDGFKWVENTSQLSKDSIENQNEDSYKGYFLEVDVQYLEKIT